MVGTPIESIEAIFPEIGRVLGEITQLLYEHSDLRPVGVYLHGSLAMNCFQPGRSDLDLLAVNRLPATPAHRRRWAMALARIAAGPYPVELSVVHLAQVEPWHYPTPYDFHWSEDWRARYAAGTAETDAVWAAPEGPDPDLAAHFTVARRRGLSLAGATVTALPVVPWADYLDSIQQDLVWAAERVADNPVYATLNACRVWAAVAAGLVLSKAEGAAWAAARLAGTAQVPATAAVTAAVQQAAAAYAGKPEKRVTEGRVTEKRVNEERVTEMQVTGEQARAVVAYVQAELKKAPATT